MGHHTYFGEGILTKVTLKGYIVVPNNELETIKQALVIHTQLTKKEPGCIVFEVTPDLHMPNRFNVYEEFIDDASFKAHQTRVSKSTWGKLTKNVARHYQVTSG